MREQVGRRLRELRKACGLTQAQVAERADLNAAYYAATERTGSNLTLDTIERLAIALGVPVVELFAFEARDPVDDRKAVRDQVKKLLIDGPDDRVHRLRVVLDQVLR